jgi:glucokinase
MFLGIEIGGTKLQLVIGDAQARTLYRHRFNVVSGKGGAGIRARIRKVLPDLIKRHAVTAIGVGFGGPVDWRAGTICCSHQGEGWSDFELGVWLRKLTALPVAVENDSNLAALGEAHCGGGQGYSPVLYTNAGSGVGGGLVVDGRIYHGASPGEVEIGHVRLNRTGDTVESQCSGWAVDRKIRALKEGGAKSLLCRLIGNKPGGEARFLAQAVAAGDESARRLLEEVADDWAFGLSHAVHVVHPQVIIIGGGLSLVGEPLRREVAEALPQYVMEAFHPVPPVKLASLGEDTVTTGALVLAKEARG